MRTLMRILVGLIAACLTAALLKVSHVITPLELSELSGDALTARLMRLGELTLLTATHQALFTVPLALIAIFIAEINRFRGWLTYTIIGMSIALAGLYLQYVGEGAVRTIINPYALQAFCIEGASAGLVYWLLSGRFAGWRRGGSLVRTKPLPVGKPRLQVSDVAQTEGKPAKPAAK
jgi:hypothetical protein